MSDRVENIYENEPVNGSIDASEAISTTPELNQSLFVQHLATYPAVAALTGLVASFPVVKVFASNAIPLMMALRERSRPVSDPVVKRASPVIIRVDKLGDSLLTTVDHTFPNLQTTQPQEVLAYATRPVTTARNAVTTYSSNTRGLVEHRIIEPIKSVTQAARTQYSRVYDTKGKALIRSRLDPVVLPINDRLESIIVDYLPEGEEFPQADNLSNELSRTWRLARVAILRAGPALAEQANQVATLPQVAREHVRQTYQEKVEKHSSNGSPTVTSYALAYLGTTRQLSRDTFSVLVPINAVSALPFLGRRHTNVTATSTDDAAGDITVNGHVNNPSVVSRATNLIYSFIPRTSDSTGAGITELSKDGSAKIQIPELPTATVQEISVEGEIH